MELHGVFFFFQAEDGIRDLTVTGVQTCALPISRGAAPRGRAAQHARAPGGSREGGGRLRAGRRSSARAEPAAHQRAGFLRAALAAHAGEREGARGAGRHPPGSGADGEHREEDRTDHAVRDDGVRGQDADRRSGARLQSATADGSDSGQAVAYRGTASSAYASTLGKIVETANPDGFSGMRSPSFPPLRSGANQYAARPPPAAWPDRKSVV